jgi:hypothetical protein
VGYQQEVGTKRRRTLIEHYDGTAWSYVPSPNVKPSSIDELTSVTSTSATNAWAVGYWRYGSSAPQILILHWNGSTWKMQTPPDTGYASEALLGVSATSGINAFAVGYGDSHTLALHCC